MAHTSFLVIFCCRLHLHRIVAISKFCEAKAAHVIKGVDAGQQFGVVSLSAKLENSATEQIKLQRGRERECQCEGMQK